MVQRREAAISMYPLPLQTLSQKNQQLVVLKTDGDILIDLKCEYDYFNILFGEKIKHHILIVTNIVHPELRLTLSMLNKYLAVLIQMKIRKRPILREYWTPKQFADKFIIHVMGSCRFRKLHAKISYIMRTIERLCSANALRYPTSQYSMLP